MNRTKSAFVTALVAALLACIVVCAYLLDSPVYDILVIALAVYGFLCGAWRFCSWLCRETPLLPASAQREEPKWDTDSDYSSTYDEIRREVQEGCV